MWWLYNENRQFCPCSLRIYFCQSIIPAGSRDYRFLNPGSGIGKRDPGLQSLLSSHYRLRPYPVIVAIRPRTHGSSSPHLASSSAMTINPSHLNFSYFFTHWTAFVIMGLDQTYHAHQFITRHSLVRAKGKAGAALP